MIDAYLYAKRMKALTWLYIQLVRIDGELEGSNDLNRRYLERWRSSYEETIKSIEDEMRKENTDVSV
jgi:hypothetical protein